MAVNFVVGRDHSRMMVEAKTIPAVPMELASWITRAGAVDSPGKLLE
jgi:hypothetical protein